MGLKTIKQPEVMSAQCIPFLLDPAQLGAGRVIPKKTDQEAHS